MNKFLSFVSGREYPVLHDTEFWLIEAKEKISELSFRRGQHILERVFQRKVRDIHRRFSRFYAPYAKRASWISSIGTDGAAPETLLLATRWLLKKHAPTAAEFRALEVSLAQVPFDEIAPAHLLEAGFLLNEYVERTNFRFSEETLASTLNDWQEKEGSSLSLAETEALFPVLRLFALDKLSAVAIRLAETERARADASRLFKKIGPDRLRFEKILRKIRSEKETLYAKMFSETFTEALERETHPFSRFREETPEKKESQAVKEISTRVRILIRSLSLLGEFEWTTLLKKTNTLHRILVRDPADVYTAMTSLSQEVYRKRASSIAKVLRVPEEAVAKTALALAKSSEESPRNHIGFFLVDDGLPILIKRLTGRSSLSWWHWYLDRERLPALQTAYFSLLFSFVAISIGIFAAMTPLSHSLFILPLLIPLLFKTGKHMIDSLFVGIVPPTFLPRLNFRRALPETVSAVFVIPAFLKNKKTLRALTEKLETAYLSNTKGNISFCLLLDYPDANRETLPEDEPLLEGTRALFRELNERYGQIDRFSFFLRSRVWSARQELWMGWERKRGKLLDFARILRGKTPSSPFVFSSEHLPAADFVITLDEDAFIPRDFIRDILGIHAHPLNTPRFQKKTLERGYTFIQPQVRQWFKNRHRFRLPRIFFDEKRFSAYSTVFPEVYQDVFLEGSYAGKGSFHVDGFLAALDTTLPTDQILSHDLLEGSLARTAYAADIDVFDEFPRSLRAFLSRSHRWTRGDWQILDWLFGHVRNERNETIPNTLRFIHRFKIADNLLQSLFRPTVFLLTLLSWATENTPLLFFVWAIFLFDLFAFDVGVDAIRWLTPFVLGRWKHLGYRLRKTLVRSGRLFRQAAFECAILPSAAIDTLHAIMTALFRRFASKKHMLEWIPSAHFENPVGRKPLIFPLFFLVLIFISLRFKYPIPPLLALLLALWMTIPALVFALNHPYRSIEVLTRRKRNKLRRDALETWSFFADTVGEETHFLPPDSARTEPDPKVASYTSITNIGFFLISILVAHRFGFISLRNALERLSKTLQTLEKLETYRGHFYNWYDVRTTLKASPFFISSVDSGNLLASLIVVRQWLSGEKTREPSRAILGLSDLSHLIQDRIPRTLDLQSFADFWEALVGRINALSTLRLKENPEALLDHFTAMKASISGIIVPKQLPNQVSNLLMMFHTRLSDAIVESEQNTRAPSTGEESALQDRLDSIIAAMRFDFLKSQKRGLLSIGYHVPSKRLEPRFYQTLASEARIGNFLALAEGTLSFRGWNKLNRTVLSLPEGPALISWTGTLFEYLMPTIFLEEHRDSLIGRSIRTAIRMNRRFAKKKHLPMWGLSESSYAEIDRGGNFRYKPFGLSSLSLSPLADERPVVSAYAIALSLTFDLRAALKNLETYGKGGGRCDHGYIEAIDFSRSNHGSPVRIAMSHHQGMILSTIGNLLFDRFLSRLFESHPLIQNSLFVLDEGIPPIDKEPFPRPALPYLQSTLVHPRTP